jgi:hypothetical protein
VEHNITLRVIPSLRVNYKSTITQKSVILYLKKKKEVDGFHISQSLSDIAFFSSAVNKRGNIAWETETY